MNSLASCATQKVLDHGAVPLAFGSFSSYKIIMEITRTFAMPNSNTFDIPPIADFVWKYLKRAAVSADLFARDKKWAAHTNDLNPATAAQYHLDAADFCHALHEQQVVLDLAIFDPPYSPRQISECYKSFGRTVTAQDTQNASLYKRCRDALDLIIKPGGVVLSFGWHSNGMGICRNYELLEILLVAHGGAHNDTICLAECKRLA